MHSELAHDFLRYAGVSRPLWHSMAHAAKRRIVEDRWPRFVQTFFHGVDPITLAHVPPAWDRLIAFVDGPRNAGDAFIVPGSFTVPSRSPTPGDFGTTAPDPVLTGPAIESVPVADGTPIAHYMDKSLASSVLYGAVQLATPDPETGLLHDGKLATAPYAQQLSATKNLFTRIGNYYKAANVRPQSDPLYVRWWLDWFGSSIVPSVVANGRAISDDAAWAADNGIGKSVMHNPSPSIINTRLLRAWTLLHKDPPDSDHSLYCNIPIRMELDQNGDLLTQCESGSRSDQTDLCDFNRGTLYVGCAQDGAGVETPDGPYDWGTFCWNDPLTPPGSVRGLCRINRALVPMKWFYDAAIDLIQRLLARTGDVTTAPVATVSDAIGYATLWNLSVGHRYHMLPLELEAYAANLPDMRQLAQLDSQRANAAVIHSTLGAAAQLSGNPYAQAYAALIEAVTSVLPAAVAVETDFFGRAFPFALKVDIQRTPAQMAPVDPSGRFGGINRRTFTPPTADSGGMGTGGKVVIGAIALGTLAKLFGWF